jgi:citrate synthase
MGRMQEARRHLTAAEAASELGITRATLYAYVSRGLIRSEPIGGTRARRYDADDVRLLRERASPARAADGQGDGPLDRGVPLLDSAITLIERERVYYRGRDAAKLAETASLETVANLLWQAPGPDPFDEPPPSLPIVDDALHGMARCIALLARAQDEDPRAFNRQPAAVARTGARLVRLLAGAWIGRAPSALPIHEALAEGWGVTDPQARGLIRAALVLHADHELNASAFTVRVVASTRASPYAAAIAGLCALQGPRHGGETARVAALLREIDGVGDATLAVRELVRRGEPLPGFGHPLYPKGDPRARVLLAMLGRHYGSHPAWATIAGLLAAARGIADVEPTIDVASTALARVLGLPPDAPLAIFATGRAAGWIAHVQEQYALPGLIRPRSRYVGEVPLGPMA